MGRTPKTKNTKTTKKAKKPTMAKKQQKQQKEKKESVADRWFRKMLKKKSTEEVNRLMEEEKEEEQHVTQVDEVAMLKDPPPRPSAEAVAVSPRRAAMQVGRDRSKKQASEDEEEYEDVSVVDVEQGDDDSTTILEDDGDINYRPSDGEEAEEEEEDVGKLESDDVEVAALPKKRRAEVHSDVEDSDTTDTDEEATSKAKKRMVKELEGFNKKGRKTKHKVSGKRKNKGSIDRLSAASLVQPGIGVASLQGQRVQGLDVIKQYREDPGRIDIMEGVVYAGTYRLLFIHQAVNEMEAFRAFLDNDAVNLRPTTRLLRYVRVAETQQGGKQGSRVANFKMVLKVDAEKIAG